MIPVTRLIYGRPCPIWLERTAGPLRAASVVVADTARDPHLHLPAGLARRVRGVPRLVLVGVRVVEADGMPPTDEEGEVPLMLDDAKRQGLGSPRLLRFAAGSFTT